MPSVLLGLLFPRLLFSLSDLLMKLCLLSFAISLGALVSCVNTGADSPGMLFDGNEDPAVAGFVGGGDASLTLVKKKDELGDSALSASGSSGAGVTPLIQYNLPAGAQAAGSIGITFQIRGSDNVTFVAKLKSLTPTAEGGTCAADCPAPHSIDLGVTTEWQTVTLRWTDLGGTGVLDPAELMAFVWVVRSEDAYNIWLDDIELLFEDPGTVTPGSGGSSSGSGGSSSSSGGSASGSGGAATAGGSSSSGGSNSNSDNALGKYVDSAMFMQAFPNRNAKYKYSKLLEAVELFPDFASCCSESDKKREVAAFLAHVTHESGGLRYTDEIDGSSKDYCDNVGACPAGEYQYWGRGSLQVTWNYNYKFAEDLFSSIGQSYSLLNNPGLVASDELLLWATGLWFWMEGDPSFFNDSPHDRLGPQGFGSTIEKINGQLECDGASPDAVAARVQYYQEWCTRLGVDPGSNLSC